MHIDVANLLLQLAVERPVFHSEDDFQNALIQSIRALRPQAKIDREFRPDRIGGQMWVDIWIREQTEVHAIELKYKTKRLFQNVSIGR